MTRLDQRLFDTLLAAADASPRRRAHHCLHSDYSDPVQRLCVGIKPGSYVRPHHHPQPGKWELLLALQGTVGVLLFDAAGRVEQRLELLPGQSPVGLEIAAGTWHALMPLTDDALFLEVKPGPYVPFDPADFAAWAPLEGSERAADCLRWMAGAGVGDRYDRTD